MACIIDVDVESSNKLVKVRIFPHDIPKLPRTNVPRTWSDTNVRKYVMPCTLSKGTGDERTKEKGLPSLTGLARVSDIESQAVDAGVDNFLGNGRRHMAMDTGGGQPAVP